MKTLQALDYISPEMTLLEIEFEYSFATSGNNPVENPENDPDIIPWD